MDGLDHLPHPSSFLCTCHVDMYAGVRNQLLYDSLGSQPMIPAALVKQNASGYSLRAGCSYALPKGLPRPLVSKMKTCDLDGSKQAVMWNVLRSL